jgi:hypothetical protein
MKLAPVTVFCYNRLDNLKVTITALQNNRLAFDSDLIIFSDGPKNFKDQLGVKNVRDYLSRIDGFKSIKVHESIENKGLAKSIIDGVSKVLSYSETIIVLEDDVKTSSNFLLFMNLALNRFEYDKNVFSISGYNYPFKATEPLMDAYFLPRICSFAWATYKRCWIDVNWRINEVNSDVFGDLNALKQGFNAGGSDLYTLFKKDRAAQINSWAIRWSYHQYLNKGLTLYPAISKVKNIGFEKGATNSNTFNKYFSELDDGLNESFTLPGDVCLHHHNLKSLQSFYSLKNRIKNRIKTYLLKLHIIKNKI